MLHHCNNACFKFEGDTSNSLGDMSICFIYVHLKLSRRIFQLLLMRWPIWILSKLFFTQSPRIETHKYVLLSDSAKFEVSILGLWVKNNFDRIHWSATLKRKDERFFRTILNWNRLNKCLYLLNYLRYHLQIWNVHYHGDEAWPCKRWSF